MWHLFGLGFINTYVDYFIAFKRKTLKFSYSRKKLDLKSKNLTTLIYSSKWTKKVLKRMDSIMRDYQNDDH